MRWIGVAAAAALVGLLAYGLASQQRDTAIDEAAASGKRIAAPVARLPRLGQAGHGSLADYRGKVVVLNFWGSWCPPCIDELPLLQRTHEAIADRNALVLGINYKDITDDAMAFVRRFGLTYPILRDPDGSYAESYGSWRFPETFVIDPAGRVAAHRRGPIDQAWLEEHLQPLL